MHVYSNWTSSACEPVLASIVDISGMWIYFTVVNHFLGLS
ncbi:Mg/Co/Ni transporter MgtE / CBS domain [Vibrio variabilis]|uniref:Mg/Co/Ni transporter MgtE / CBS domain n=1 Tax=Vibrio variabilis TaxID=990271 RepID=A0ABQ0J809_9VIBR|nr:Mg/Co/Ni transporter MgtE / CBS domain [Vibrio variabilis]